MFTDIENAELLVVWGANPATDSPPLDMYRLEAAARRGARVVVIDPRRTETVARTGAEWIPIRPGTDGALALGLIGVLLDEELFDAELATRWCHGFEELRTYVQHFPPEAAEAITGVPAETVRSLARRIAGATGACPIMYTGLEYSNSGIQAIRAVLALFALAGHLDAPGGIGLAMPATHFPVNRSSNVENPDVRRAVARDRFPIYSLYRGEGHASGLVTSVLEGKPYRIRALIVHGASLLTSWPETPLWRRTLAGLDFVVTIDRQLTADAQYADVVLPATTMFEIDSYMVYGPIFRLREKLIEPVGEARNDYLIMAELARRLGYGEQYPQTEDALLRCALEGSGFTLEDVRAAGGSVRIPAPLMEYRKWTKGKLRSDGRPGFETPTGKLELRSTVLEEYGYEPLPKYAEPHESPLSRPDLAAHYPLVFNSGARPHTDFRSQDHGVPGLLRDNPEPTVELSRADATARGIETGDLVEVRTPRGAVRFRARVTDDIVRGAVECSMGGGTPVGPRAWQESNVNELTDLSNYDEISGFPVYKALLCEVVRVAGGRGRSASPGARRHVRGAALRRRAALAADAPHRPRQQRHHGGRARGARGDAALSRRRLRQPFEPARARARGARGRGGRAPRPSRASSAHALGASPSPAAARSRTTWRSKAWLSPSETDGVISSPAPSSTRPCSAPAASWSAWAFVSRSSASTRTASSLPRSSRRALTDETLLVSIQMANNEVGTVQPVRELAALAHARGALFHTDAVQAVGKIPVDVEELGVDLLTLAAHKLHGPKGVGALYVRQGITLEPLVHGGRQEGGLRAGTENVAGIVGLGKAAELALADPERWERVARSA